MIHVITGLMNSGKTLYMTKLGFRNYLLGRQIISNYSLNFPHFKVNKDYIMTLGEKQPVLKNVCFLLDELWIWLDCRDSFKNKVATYFFLQSSKDDTNIYITAQTNQQNEKRIRDNLHKITTCSRCVLESGIFKEIVDDKRFLLPSILERMYIKAVNFKRVNMGIFSDIKHTDTEYIKAQTYISLYNTREKISAKVNK